MKAIVLVMSLLLAGSAFAGTDFEAMSWSSILRSGKYDPDYSNKIHFQNASVWVPSFSNRLCTDGTFIYGGTFLKKYEVGGDDSGVFKTVKVDLVQPIVSERQRCKSQGEDNCKQWETVVYKQSPNRMINVLAAGNQDDEDKQILGVKSYRIPTCGKMTPVPAN